MERLLSLLCMSYWAASLVRYVLFYDLFFSLFPQDPFSNACFENTETASFHGGITLASILVLKSLDRIARWKKTVNSPSSIRQQFRYVLPAKTSSLFLFWEFSTA